MNNKIVINCGDDDSFKEVDMYINSIELDREPFIKEILVSTYG